MKTRILSLDEAVGLSLSHDLTQIVPATGFKGARFSRGHVVAPEDLPILRSMGKEHLSVLELDPEDVHEDDAAKALAEALAGSGMEMQGPEEGKCVLRARWAGLVLFDGAAIHAINSNALWSVATVFPRTAVTPGQTVAACRVIPLAISRDLVSEACLRASPMEVRPFHPRSVGLVTTGKELAEGRVMDAFLPKLREKLVRYGGSVLAQRFAADDPDDIAAAVEDLLVQGATLVLCTGGMSVDADDRTPAALRRVADRVCFQGVPMMPGSMLMLALRGDVPLVGAPACVVHDERTALDPLLDALFAGMVPLEEEIRRWGVGGLCLRCSSCVWPRCSFGHGS